MKLKCLQAILGCVAMLLLTINATAQDSKAVRLKAKAEQIKSNDAKVSSVEMNEDRETPFMITFDTESEEAYKLEDAQRLIESKLGLEKSIEKIQYSKTIELPKTGMEVQRFEQYYQGVKVEHGDYVAMAAGGKLNLITGEYYELENINTIASITEEQALEAAKKFIGAQNYAWDFLVEQFNGVVAPEHLGKWRSAYNEYWPTGEVVIVDNYTTKDLDLDLAYKFNVFATNPMSRDEVYVNAHTGKIMFKNAIIKHFQRDQGEPIDGNNGAETSVVQTRYSGMQEIGVTKIAIGSEEPNPLFDQTGGLNEIMDSRAVPPLDQSPFTGSGDVFVLIDQTRDDINSAHRTYIETYDVNGLGGVPVSVPIYGQARSFTDDDNTWEVSSTEHLRSTSLSGTAILDPLNREYDDDIAWDAHWGATMVYDYWQLVHSRDSYDGQGASILSYVHIGNAFDNAFWNGTAMSYGDGQNFKSLTSLDVCGHEIGHAICSSTSDLVYARQSGGMNEGFSDIWGACIEYFILKDPTNAALGYQGGANPDGYRPFGIGEQIGSGGVPLRWMDAPKEAGDPDTFGGDNWRETENCDPSLANDQCGVHSNSGVLNKWFYLMATGAGAGSGPDAQFAGTGVNLDDGENDNGDKYDGTGPNGANIEGLGFIISEQIAFGAEVLLTANSTFADCRSASIAVARAMSDITVSNIGNTQSFNFSGGFCGDIETNVTNAWYGVGVGDAFDCAGLDNLKVGFIVSTNSVVEGSTDIECSPTTDLVVNYFMNETVSETITVTGTATEGEDYIINLPNKEVSNTSGYINTSFVIEIVDDAKIETPETIILTFANGSLPDFATHTITLNDNDVEPTIGAGIVNLLEEDFETVEASGFPLGWETLDKSGTPVVQWEVGAPSGGNSAPLNLTDVAFCGVEVAGQRTNTYEGTAAATDQDTYLISEKIDARGISDVRVTFDWSAGGERDAGINATPFDYGELMYSFDKIEFIATDQVFAGDGAVSPIAPSEGNFSEIFEALNGKEFYLVWRWVNDPLVGAGFAFSIDNVVVSGAPVEIESQFNHGTTERVDAGTDIYFLSSNDSEILTRISAAASPLACVSSTIAQAGTSTMGLSNGDRSEKAFSITDVPDNVSHTVSLYYKLSEIDASFLEADGETLKSDVYITQMTGDITGTTPTTVTIKDGTGETAVQSITDRGTGAVIGLRVSGTFTGSGIYTISNATQEISGNLAVDLINLTATPKEDVIQLDWTTATETENKGFYIERQIEGTRTWETIGFVEGNGTTSTANRYFHTDATVKAGVIYLYRLAQEDFNGSINNSKVVRAQLNGKDVVYDITPNPANDHINVRFYTNVEEQATITLLSVAGQALTQTVTTSDVTTTRIDLSNYPSGVYFVKVETTQGAKVDRIVKR